MNIKTPVSWIGNKSSILPIIYAMFPVMYDRYIEPFGGSGAVLLGKKVPDKFEVYNDFNHNLVNLFRCMRDRPVALIKELGFFNLNSRDDFNMARDFFKYEKFYDRYIKNETQLTQVMFSDNNYEEIVELFTRRILDYDLRRASMFLKVLRYSYSSSGKSFASQPFDISSLFILINEVSARLKNTIIENQSFEVLIPHYDRKGAFFYCDPPYVSSEYVYDCGFTKEMHLLLRDILMSIDGLFLLSYNDCPEVREWYKGCYFYDFKRVHSMVQRYSAGKEFSELLVANYDITLKEKTAPHQLDITECNNKLITHLGKIVMEGVTTI